MKIFTKKATIAVSLLTALSLSGCFQDVPNDQNSKSTSGASTSATPSDATSATPSATSTANAELEKKLKINDDTVNPTTEAQEQKAAELNKEYMDEYEKLAKETPLGIDIAATVSEKASSEAKETFKDMNINEGTRTSLEVIQTLTTNAGFYKARDTSHDADNLTALIPLTTEGFRENALNDIKKNNRLSVIPTTNAEGNMGTDSKGENIFPLSTPEFTYWVTDIDTHGEYLLVSGYTELVFYTKANVQATIGYNWVVTSIPGADSLWQVDKIAYTIAEVKNG